MSFEPVLSVPRPACVLKNMVFNRQLNCLNFDEVVQNLPSSLGAPWTDDDDLFIQSDNEVTPMTDIEDSSGDEAFDENYLRMHMQTVHDVVESSHDVYESSNTRTTNQTNHVIPEVKKSPVVDVTGRDSNGRNEEEVLDTLKRNLVHTRDMCIAEPVVETKAILSDIEQPSEGHQDKVTDARPSVSGPGKQTIDMHATVYKYDDVFRSDSICHVHIKKESYTQETFPTATYEGILMKPQSEGPDSETSGIRSMSSPSGDVLAATRTVGEGMDCNIEIKREQVPEMVHDHHRDTALDKEEMESGKRIDSKIFSLHVEKNAHTYCDAPGAADGDGGVNGEGENRAGAAAAGGGVVADDAEDDDDDGDNGDGGDVDLGSCETGNSGMVIKMEVCDSVDDSVSVTPHPDQDMASSLDGCNTGVSTKRESCVNITEPLPSPKRLDKPCEYTEYDKVQVNLNLVTRKSVTPDIQTEPSATNPRTDPSVPPLQEAPGKGALQQQSSPRHKKHQKKKRGPKPKPGKACSVCKKRFSSSELKQHIKTSHRHSCEICRKTIKDLVLFQGHMREHAGEPTPYWCDQCDKRFDSFTSLDRHRRMHSLKGRWECSHCGKVLTRRDNYLQHLKIHEDANMNKCDVCGRQYASAANLRKHMVVHLEEKPIECPVCEKRFNFKSTLDYHMRRHTAATVKSATCEICGMECIHKSSLAAHMNIHTGMKPHVCIYCGKRFAQLSTKIGHEMNHENPNKKSLDTETAEQRTKNILQSFDCDHCLMSFTSLDLLNGHVMKTHANISKVISDSEMTPECIKPYSCGICGMAFLSVSGLRKHRMKKHPEHVGVGKGRYSSLGKNLPSNETGTDETMPKVKKSATVGSARNPNNPDTADQPTSESESDPEKDLPTSKQKSDPTEDLPTSKQGSTGGETERNIDKNKCNICGKLVLELRNHMKYHSEKAYVCRVCGMRFAISANLKRHLRQHTGETPFQCKTCGERFIKAEALKKHMARHDGKELEKKYECSICGKKFLDNYHLKRHSVVHKRWPKVRKR